MSKDLFAALSVSSLANTMFELETRINYLVNHRHDYPMWPEHDHALDEYEEEIHYPMRKVYYKSTIVLLHTLQELRKLS